MRPGGRAAFSKRALKPSRSDGRAAMRGVNGPRSHEPQARTMRRARNVSVPMLATYPSPSRRTASTTAGCMTHAPSTAALCSNAASRISRPIARPQACGWAGAGIGASMATSRAKKPTRSTGGPACGASSAATPSSSRIGHVVAEMYSPQTFRRGNSAFSATATRRPRRASKEAAVAPEGPPPTMSAWRITRRFFAPRRDG